MVAEDKAVDWIENGEGLDTERDVNRMENMVANIH